MPVTTLNYVGEPALLTEPYAFPTYARQEGLPPTLIINSDHDGMRSSGEANGAQLVAAGVDIVVIREVAVYHGHLNAPETTAPRRPLVEWSIGSRAAN